MTPYIRSLAQDRPLNQQYPHCDWRVLHSPGACQYCDMHPDWQQDRTDAWMLFTDDSRNAEIIERFLATGHTSGIRPCPAMLARGDRCQVWGGNVPKPKGP